MVSVAFEEAGVLFSEGCPERRDGIFHSSFMEGDGIELTFTYESEFFFAHRFNGMVEGKEEFRLIEEDGVARVDVFSTFVISAKNATAESDNVAHLIMDGKHQLIPEFMIKAGARIVLVFHSAESGIDDFATVIFLLADVSEVDV